MRRELFRLWDDILVPLAVILFIVGLFGYAIYYAETTPDCYHTVYVQTTPVNGQPAYEEQHVCR